MNRFRLHITKKIQSTLFIVATIFFVLLTSCAVKSSIKSWADIASSTAQAPIKSGNLFSSSITEKCINSETTDTQISQIVSFQAGDYAPIVLFTLAFMLLFSVTVRSQQAHPHYGNLKISGSIPIFIRDRNLQI
ncbi:hypothetical protein KO02_08225 [Sphingobacterium sp. ML3W]|uniref:hypothetical protein n=1 Tax=Sphingobacterium sp. ML3W TaxID=1538644 RepID=UPI0004F71ABD|nr:hypothetical protein [Sphingobacterium sp. ML3W]AIM36695.1 hypothetical protein KO02_08225 [Sphingobacterium sp. ML3W]